MIREAEERGEIANEFDLEFAVNRVKAYFVHEGSQNLGGFYASVFLVEVIPKVVDLGDIMLGDVRMKANRLWRRARLVRFQFSLLRFQGLEFVEKGGPGSACRNRVDDVGDPPVDVIQSLPTLNMNS